MKTGWTGASLSSRWTTWAVVAAALLTVGVVAVEYSMIAGLPFFSEDYTLTALAATQAGPLDALSLELVPLRPLQHLFFHWVAHGANGVAATARIPGVALHMGSCLLVYFLARKLGAGVLGGVVAMTLYAVFPNCKSFVWTAAIGWPGRQFFLLLSLVAFLHHAQKSSLLATCICVTSLVLALGFHQGAFLLPVLAVACSLGMADAGSQGSARAVIRRLKDPLLLGITLLVIVYLVYLVVLRDNRHTEVRSFAALPANLVKSSLCLFPEWYRQFVVEGLRGGGLGFLAAAGAFLVVPILVGVILCKGSLLARCLLSIIVLDLALPALTTGFVQRYAYLASAFLACGLGRWIETLGARSRVGAGAIFLLLATQWAYDSHRDIQEYREAGRVTTRLLQQALAAYEERAPEESIIVVNIPTCWGSENDLPLFNWGFGQALLQLDQAQNGAGRAGSRLQRLELWRTRILYTNFTNSDLRLVSEARLLGAIRNPSSRVLEYDVTLRRFQER